jgi:DNA-binding beta-propeller fold protein YncE
MGAMRVLLRGLLLALTLLILTACTTLKPPAEAPGRPLWPAPPELPRFAYEYTLRTPADIVVPDNPQDRLRRQVSGERLDQPVFEKVGAVAAGNGLIYGIDTVKRWVVVFDVPRRKVFRLGLREPGNLAKPLGLALDGEGNLYVVDGTRGQVLVYDSYGLHLRTIGERGELERATGVAVDRAGSRIYVIDRASNESDLHRVVVYDRDGKRLFAFGQRGSGAGDFNVPVQAAVAADGTLYVLDAGNFRVQAFDRDGKFLRAFGAVGPGYGQFARPRGIAVDRDGNVYVSDAAFGNIQVFNAEGELLIAVGAVSRRDGPGRYGLVSGIAVDETRRIYVADQLFSKIEVIRRVGEAEARELVKRAETQ